MGEIHKKLDLNPWDKFRIVGDDELLTINEDGYILIVEDQSVADIEHYIYALNNGVIKEQRYAQEVVKAFKALYTLGYRWVAKNADGSVFAYDKKPYLFVDSDVFSKHPGGRTLKPIHQDILQDTVEWNYDNPKPLSILQALSEAGENVELL